MSEFLSENFPFLVVKFRIYLNRHVFVMVVRNAGISAMGIHTFKIRCLRSHLPGLPRFLILGNVKQNDILWVRLEFLGPVNSITDMSSRSVYLTILFLCRISSLSG